ncbi:gluconate 2-dehydrogenase [Clostridium algifaecis]|uniref:Gluconate 2-dehydrogenase n=1 Tax=Clostridium algifaecis TaxID=1472040 RepID=A0ABS4KRC1_9CLOT|nr:D-glycerate dehydrogenase [Clostridium algifaecis]MBP2031419.1 gluconate 2-dehydrogenase [Clostridium algifaecis]
MSKFKVFIEKSIADEIKEYISQYCDCKFWDYDKKISREELFQELKNVEGLLENGERIDEELLSHAPNLKIVSNSSVGYNNFDLKAMKSRGVMGTNTPYVLDDTVADLVFSLILSTARRVTELDSYVKQGKWNKNDEKNLYGIDVHHTTLGIIGMGRIGRAIAKRAKLGFDMDVLYHNRSRKYDLESELGTKYVSLDTLLIQSDYIVLMTPLTDETEHLIDYKEFDLMKDTAIFINASRGKTVNEEALINALKNKKIFGAGLDVYDVEPVNKDNPLLKMPNVVTLPHIGSATARTRFDMDMRAAKNLVQGITGKIPQDLVPELKSADN